MLPPGGMPSPAGSRESNASVLLPDYDGVNINALLAVIPDNIFQIGRDGVVLRLVRMDDSSSTDFVGCVGQRLQDVLPEEVAAEYLSFIEAAIVTSNLQQFEYNIANGDRVFCFTTRIIRHDEESVLAVVRLETDADRRQQVTQPIARDVDTDAFPVEVPEHPRTEEQIRISEERLSLVVQATRVGVWDCDLVNGTVWWNSQYNELFGARPDNTAESWDWWVNRIHPDDRDRVVESYEQTLKQPTTRWHVEYRFLDANEVYIDILDSAHITRNANGEATRILGAMLEVTAFKQAEQALQNANQRKDEFLAMLAHELRNPLAPIRTAIDLMSLEQVDNPQVIYARKLIGKQVNHLVRMVEDLLDVSRITRGMISLQRTNVNLGEIIEEVVASTSKACAEREHELLVTLPDETIHIDADPTRLLQVFSNLLGNAIRYTPPNGKIEVCVKARDGVAHISVRDNGIGIASDDADDIFDLFVQSKREIDRSQGGLGIGLTLVKKLVELHDGIVSVESAGVDQGSEFVVRLPIKSISDIEVRPNRSIETHLPSARDTSDEGKPRILVVDDLPEAAESMCALLTTLGYDVHIALGGQAAIEVAPQLRLDAMLIDIGMPGIDGYEVARQIRSNEATVNVVLIAVSGYCNEEDQLKSKQAGFDFHLPKPATVTQINHALNTLLHRR